MENQIRDAAYYKWLHVGSPYLTEEEQRRLWLEAEEDLLRSQGKPYRVLLNTNNGKVEEVEKKEGKIKIDASYMYKPLVDAKKTEEKPRIEIRKYYPQKRLIVAAHREYYLQFPYIIFACRTHSTGSYLYVGFAKQDDGTIYFPSLPNMCPQTYGICLARSYGDGHFKQSVGATLDQLIELFWITEFDPWEYGWEIGHRSLMQNFQGRYNYWKKLSLPEVLTHVSYMPRPFDFFVKRISQHYEDMEMRVLIGNHTDCETVKTLDKVDVESDEMAPAFRR